MRTRRETLALLGVMALALATRLWWLLAHAPGVIGGTHDEAGYVEMARQLIARGVYGYYSTSPNAYTVPGYSLFVTGVFKLADAFGAGPAGELIALRVAQLLLGLAAVWLVYELGRRVANTRVGLVAAAVAAIYPSSLMAQGRILTESLFAALLLAWLLVALTLRERRTWRWHALAGALLAVLVLVRPTAALLGLVVYALDLAEKRDWRFAASSLVALLAFCLVMSPWWIRNRVALHETVLVATQTGDPFLRGTDPWDPYDHIGPSIIAGVAPADMTRVGIERVKAGLREAPATWIAWFTVGKWWYLWRMPWYESSWFSRVMHWAFVLVLGWIGVVAGLFDRRMRLLAWSVVVMTIVQLAFIPIPRYMYPLSLVAMVLAAGVAVLGWETVGGETRDSNRLDPQSSRKFPLRRPGACLSGVRHLTIVRALGCERLEVARYPRGKNTLCSLVDYLTDAFLPLRHPRLQPVRSGSRGESKEVFALDPGLAFAVSPPDTLNFGARPENAVFLELRRRLRRSRDTTFRGRGC